MDINIKIFRIFHEVIKQGSFSAAAKSLGITQPTVSQQISKLESELQVKLFERVGHEVKITDAAKDLSVYVDSVLEMTDQFYDNFKSSRHEPKGLVRYAMPESCQWTPHFKKIVSQLSDYPEIQFDIDIISSDRIAKGVLEGSYDFGFVTGDKISPELRFEKFSDERYSMVASDKELFKPLKNKSPKDLRLISYEGWELFFTAWLKASGLGNNFKNQMRKPAIKIGTLTGAIHAVKEGAGVAVVPTHCISRDLFRGELVEYGARDIEASNPIYLTRKVGAKLPRRAELVVDLLKKAKLELG